MYNINTEARYEKNLNLFEECLDEFKCCILDAIFAFPIDKKKKNSIDVWHFNLSIIWNACVQELVFNVLTFWLLYVLFFIRLFKSSVFPILISCYSCCPRCFILYKTTSIEIVSFVFANDYNNNDEKKINPACFSSVSISANITEIHLKVVIVQSTRVCIRTAWFCFVLYGWPTCLF